MSRIAIEVLIIGLLILLNGLFSMAEIAVVSARKTKLQQRAQEGDKRAQAALDLANAPNQFLATIQIGITLVGIVAGAFGGATIAEELATALEKVPPLAPYGEAIGVTLVILLVTYLTLVVGELVPKRLGLGNPEQVAARFAPFMRTLSRLASPLVRSLSFSTDLVVRLLRVPPRVEAPVSEEEINLLLEHGARAGIFAPAEQAMVEQVFRLGDVAVKAVMTPRVEILWLNLEDTEAELRDGIASGRHSRYPAARGDLDHVLGLVYAKDLLAAALEGRPLDIESRLRPALFVPESVTALEALEQLKEGHTDVALVVDEHGGLEGLLSADDILRAIVGDIPALGGPAEPGAVRREDGSWLLDGMLPVEKVKELLGVDSLPHEGAHYQTLGGLAMVCLERIPMAGDRFVCRGWQLEVVDMDGRRVDKLLAVREDPVAPVA